MKVAYVHDWLVTYRGGEKVLEALLDLYPEAPIYTLFFDAAKMPETISRRKIICDPWLNWLFPIRKLLLPILPAAIEAMPLEDYDLIISTSSCVAKGVLAGPKARHISYIHSPMRYIWDQRVSYLTPRRRFSPKEFIIHMLFQNLRIWDNVSNNRVDSFIANSTFVQSRIKRYYGRESEVVFPPVEVEKFRPQLPKKGGYFLIAGAFVKYKRFDLAIAACERLGLKLVVAGSGPMAGQLKKVAGKNTTFKFKPGESEWISLFQNADAFIFPGVEDFGISAVEALAAGTPVIAFKSGGALDFVVEGKTGMYFDEQTVDSLVGAIERFKRSQFDAKQIIEFASKFSKENFVKKMNEKIKNLVGEA